MVHVLQTNNGTNSDKKKNMNNIQIKSWRMGILTRTVFVLIQSETELFSPLVIYAINNLIAAAEILNKEREGKGLSWQKTELGSTVEQSKRENN